MWKNEKIITEEISRQINYLFSNHNSKSLESRNFFHKKRVRVNFRTFYTVFVHTKCGKTRNSLSLKQNFAIYFREIDWMKSTIMVFDKINSFTNTMQAVWKRTIKSDHAKKFREINSLVKTLIWRKNIRFFFYIWYKEKSSKTGWPFLQEKQFFFVKSTFLLKKLLKKGLFHGNFERDRVFTLRKFARKITICNLEKCVL